MKINYHQLRKKMYKLLFIFLLLEFHAVSQTICELNESVDNTYHDTIYHKIADGVKFNEWNLVGIKEKKNSITEKLLDINITSQLIKSNKKFQIGDSVTKHIVTKGVLYAGMRAYKKELISVRKLGIGNLRLDNGIETKVNCYSVLSINTYLIESNSITGYTDKINAFYFTNDNELPVAWFAESRLTAEASNLSNYLVAFVSQGFPDTIKNYTYSELMEAVHFSCSPNPSHTNTAIAYTLPYDANIELSIKNITSANSAIIENTNKRAGNYSQTIVLTDYKPGIYTLQLSINSMVLTTQLVVN